MVYFSEKSSKIAIFLADFSQKLTIVRPKCVSWRSNQEWHSNGADTVINYVSCKSFILAFDYYHLPIIIILLFPIVIWSDVPKNYVSELGCYFGAFFTFFLAPYTNIHSFFIALFRYVCIIHPEKLSNQNISPEVSTYTFFKKSIETLHYFLCICKLV